MKTVQELDSSKTVLPSPVFISQMSSPRKKRHPKCENCGMYFKKVRDLKLHLDEDKWADVQAELSENSFKCDPCCIFFTTEQGLKQHLGKVHIKKYKYSKCQFCAKKFRNKYAVRFHIKQVHEKSTREACEICGKEFYNKYLVPKHLEKCKKLRGVEIDVKN
jgi:hypothetical protein